ncbi:hypothetical protein [Acidiphilium sp. C61]|uniref:hypothetical protein n=1 Tax=Acidiphilium sp. C61 TaxID=1671485 RepID=UPI001C2D98F6|nr:hypothetical protein [Acidiphilium sp. C61]
MPKLPKKSANSRKQTTARGERPARREASKPLARSDREIAGKSARAGREKREEGATVQRRKRPSRALPAKPPATISVSAARDRMTGLVDSIILHGGSTNILYHDKVAATLAPPEAVPADQITREFTVDGLKKFPRALTGVGLAGPYALVRKGERVAVLYAPTTAESGVLAEDQIALTIRTMADAWTSLGKHISTAKDHIRAVNRLRANAIEATRAQIGLLERSGRKDLARQLREDIDAIEAKAARDGFV